MYNFTKKLLSLRPKNVNHYDFAVQIYEKCYK